jgi:hypothetical protein
MYTQLDVVGEAEARADAVALKDRARYLKFFEAAERFAAEAGLIVAGSAATRLLLGDHPEDPTSSTAPPPVTRDSFQCDFFSGQAPAHARALAEVLYKVDPAGLGHYVTVLTKVAGYLLTVTVDGRDLFTVTALPVHRGVRTADVVIPSQRPAQFARGGDGRPIQLQCTGPEIQLMGVYAALCNPAKAGSWGKLLATERSLRELFRAEIRRKIETAVARARDAQKEGGASQATDRLWSRLRGEYATGPGRVLVGPAAVALVAPGRPGAGPRGRGRLQVVAAGELEAEAGKVAALAREEGLEAQWTQNDPKIPTDPRLRRLTVHVVQGARREPILDIYNAAAHELIPFATLGEGGELMGSPAGEDGDGRAEGGRRGPGAGARRRPGPTEGGPAGLKIGTPFALMRFRLADMWTMQVLMRMKAVDAAYGRSVLLEMLGEYEAVAAHYEGVARELDPEHAAALLLPPAAYIGRLEEPELALKRAAQTRAPGKFFPPYLPASRGEPRRAGAQSPGPD